MIDAEAISARVRELGAEISEAYEDQALIVICVLKGSFMFMADLVRALDVDVRCEFLGVSSYEGTQSSGAVRITLDLKRSIEGKHAVSVVANRPVKKSGFEGLPEYERIVPVKYNYSRTSGIEVTVEKKKLNVIEIPLD